jgi:hypothetical protein
MTQPLEEGVVPIGAYVAPRDRHHLRELAHVRGVPVSVVIREAIRAKIAAELRPQDGASA